VICRQLHAARQALKRSRFKQRKYNESVFRPADPTQPCAIRRISMAAATPALDPAAAAALPAIALALRQVFKVNRNRV
jgi:hypothetical protein